MLWDEPTIFKDTTKRKSFNFMSMYCMYVTRQKQNQNKKKSFMRKSISPNTIQKVSIP